MLQVYGIPNCQTVKKARVWLEENKVDYEFHNFKTEAPTKALLQAWLKHVPLEALVNKRGTTWRKLGEAEQHALQHADTALAVLIAHPSVIKRPVSVSDQLSPAVQLGFDAATFQNLYGSDNT